MADKLPPVDVEATIVARLRPGLIALLLAVCLCGIVLTAGAGWWMLFERASEEREWFALAFGVLLLCTALIVVQMAVALGWLLVTASLPVLVITPAGLIDRRLSPKLIPWAAVTQISEARSTQGMPALIGSYVGVDPAVMNDLPASWPRSWLQFLPRSRKPIATITAVATDIDPRRLHATLSAFWKAYKDQKEPINV